MNSRGREPTETSSNNLRPLRGRTIYDLLTVGFTHGYSHLAASRPVLQDNASRYSNSRPTGPKTMLDGFFRPEYSRNHEPDRLQDTRPS